MTGRLIRLPCLWDIDGGIRVVPIADAGRPICRRRGGVYNLTRSCGIRAIRRVRFLTRKRIMSVVPLTLASLETMKPTFLTALPVYNEVSHVVRVLEEVGRYSSHILVVNDGSTDGTEQVLTDLLADHERRRQTGQKNVPHLTVTSHEKNRGYGGALETAFRHAISHGYDVLVSIDCDGQHQPRLIPHFVDVCLGRGELPDLHLVAQGRYKCDQTRAALEMGRVPVDLVSGSRYLRDHDENTAAPEARKMVNATITADLNRLLDFDMTDAFCGFKAYRVEAIKALRITEFGYAMPLQLWVQAAAECFSVIELPVPRVYTGEQRSFGAVLDDAETRLAHYRNVILQSRKGVETSPCGERLAIGV